MIILQQIISRHILITVIWKSLLSNSKKVRACALVSVFIEPLCFLPAWGSTVYTKHGPKSMNHPYGPSPWTPLWPWSMDYPRDPLLIFEDEFYQSRVVAKEISLGLKRKWRQQKEGGMVPSLLTLGKVWLFLSVSY